MPSGRIRVALVGLGDIGLGAHLPALMRSPRVELVGLVDTDPVRRSTAAKVAGDVPIVATLQDLWTTKVDAVVLATPPWVTAPLAAEVLQQGLFCLAEKPLGVTSADVSALVAQAGPSAARLQVGLTYRHDPAMDLLRSWIADGRLGDALVVRAHVYDEPRTLTEGNYRTRVLDSLEHGAPVLHEGAHVLDWLDLLLGEQPQLRDAWSHRTEAGLPNANVIGARLAYGPHTVLLEVGWWTDAQPPCAVSLFGSEGYVTLDVPTFRLEWRGIDSVETIVLPGDRTARSFDRQLDRFLDLVMGRQAVAEPGVERALSTLQLSEHIVAKAAQVPVTQGGF